MVTLALASAEVTRIKLTINDFLKQRLQAKLDKLKGDTLHELKNLPPLEILFDGKSEELMNEVSDELRELVNNHRPEQWLSDAAHRVSQIQQVTHGVKFTHPDARGSQLFSKGNSKAGDHLIGTHCLEDRIVPDVVGNAAALDVYKFLRLEVDGKTLLNRSIEKDAALARALTDDPERAESWMAAFAAIATTTGNLRSHALAKQLYWPVESGQYHLLSPLFPTSLVHRVWAQIREDRFSPGAQAAREARRNNHPHPNGFSEYPDLVVQKFGGTKPQNISQLNSERYGENYLLASVPPNWHSELIRPPLKIETIFGPWFERRSRVYHLIQTLQKFLLSVQHQNNVNIRNKRAELIDLIRDELLQFTAALGDLSPGWSNHPDCRLHMAERYWLDGNRGLEDKIFATDRASIDWRTIICTRFANWLNARLNTEQIKMGDAEHLEWSNVLADELRMMREELDFND
jgi:CRISPR-associated protein Csy1